MKTATFLLLLLTALVATPEQAIADDSPKFLQMDADVLEDKIRGGMLAQIIGNLNGLPHEFKYIDEPGNVVDYTPNLPDGAYTDDDTDVEWVYLREIARSRQSLLPPDRIAELWKTHINRKIYASNHYARQLMDLGLAPPWTGNVALNPWSEFNISGQFLCESFGLMAPAMPQTAARTGLNYTRVAIDGEPAQSTQLFTTMIAMAFVESDVDRLLDAGLASVDPASKMAEVVRETRTICREHSDDWRAARQEIKRRWQKYGGEMRDRNGYELNGACTVAALIYGRKDLVETLRLAFNLGWDCDNNAATAATIVGVIHGRKWMNEQGWDIADVYRNTTRDEMPMDETISGLEDTLIDCARVVIVESGGGVPFPNGQGVYQIRSESPGVVYPLHTPNRQLELAREAFEPQLEKLLDGSDVDRARAAYVALCLGEAESLAQRYPDRWSAALADLQGRPEVVRNIFRAPEPSGTPLRERATRAGLKPPNDDSAD
jgi:hypothetical protein